jgi:hypothetical protein
VIVVHCDACGAKGATERRLYLEGARHGEGRWYDLCEACEARAIRSVGKKP